MLAFLNKKQNYENAKAEGAVKLINLSKYLC